METVVGFVLPSHSLEGGVVLFSDDAACPGGGWVLGSETEDDCADFCKPTRGEAESFFSCAHVCLFGIKFGFFLFGLSRAVTRPNFQKEGGGGSENPSGVIISNRGAGVLTHKSSKLRKK